MGSEDFFDQLSGSDIAQLGIPLLSALVAGISPRYGAAGAHAALQAFNVLGDLRERKARTQLLAQQQNREESKWKQAQDDKAAESRFVPDTLSALGKMSSVPNAPVIDPQIDDLLMSMNQGYQSEARVQLMDQVKSSLQKRENWTKDDAINDANKRAIAGMKNLDPVLAGNLKDVSPFLPDAVRATVTKDIEKSMENSAKFGEFEKEQDLSDRLQRGRMGYEDKLISARQVADDARAAQATRDAANQKRIDEMSAPPKVEDAKLDEIRSRYAAAVANLQEPGGGLFGGGDGGQAKVDKIKKEMDAYVASKIASVPGRGDGRVRDAADRGAPAPVNHGKVIANGTDKKGNKFVKYEDGFVQPIQ